MDADAIDLALLAFRCVIGAVMFAHGFQHLFRGGKVAGTASWFESLGMRPGIVHAWLASLVELAAGVSLIVGVLTPLGGAAVVGTMTVAFVANHRGNGFFIFRPGEGWEYVMTLCAAGLVLSVLGAGRFSVDHALGIFDPPAAVGLWIALGPGFAGALVLLGLSWRPEASSA